VRVEFDEENADERFRHREYAGRLRALSEKENLSPFDRGAFATMLEHGVRMAGRATRSRRGLWHIADLAREAHYAAKAADEHVVRAEHVRKALSSKMERHNLVETRIREMIEEGTLLVDVAGNASGR